MGKQKDYLSLIDTYVIKDRYRDNSVKAVTLPGGTKVIICLRTDYIKTSSGGACQSYFKVYTPFNVVKVELNQLGLVDIALAANFVENSDAKLSQEQESQLSILLDAPSNIHPSEIDVWRKYVAKCAVESGDEDAGDKYYLDCIKDTKARQERYLNLVSSSYQQDIVSLEDKVYGHQVVFGDIDD